MPRGAGQNAARDRPARPKRQRKIRFKIVKGAEAHSIVADSVRTGKEELQSVWVQGVDLNEVNIQEVHLQAAIDKGSQLASAEIPVPGGSGVLDDYQELYTRVWRDPHNRVRTSWPFEAEIDSALRDGSTYYMDEDDRAWLDNVHAGDVARQNTSLANATNLPPSPERSPERKDKEVNVQISEDLFELVMGVFEMVTHDQMPFLHVSLKDANSTDDVFPPMSDYEETFSQVLPQSYFAAFEVPEWVPGPDQLLGVAKIIYPHWRNRRLGRQGHRIIAVVNTEDSEANKDNFYGCFRNRSPSRPRDRSTAVAGRLKKSTERMKEIRWELEYAEPLALMLETREVIKREVCAQKKNFLDNCFTYLENAVDRDPLTSKEMESILDQFTESVPRPMEHEPRPKEEPKRIVQKPPRGGSNAQRSRRRTSAKKTQQDSVPEPPVSYSTRVETINQAIENETKEINKRDSYWENRVDDPYQKQRVSEPQRLFKNIHPSGYGTHSQGAVTGQVSQCAFRFRVGRGGRLLFDRSSRARPSVSETMNRIKASPRYRQFLEDERNGSPEARASIAAERDDWVRKQLERWKFDDDDGAVPKTAETDEQDRELIGEFDARYLRHNASLLDEADLDSLHCGFRTGRGGMLKYEGVDPNKPRRPSPSDAELALYGIYPEVPISMRIRMGHASQPSIFLPSTAGDRVDVPKTQPNTLASVRGPSSSAPSGPLRVARPMTPEEMTYHKLARAEQQSANSHTSVVPHLRRSQSMVVMSTPRPGASSQVSRDTGEDIARAPGLSRTQSVIDMSSFLQRYGARPALQTPSLAGEQATSAQTDFVTDRSPPQSAPYATSGPRKIAMGPPPPPPSASSVSHHQDASHQSSRTEADSTSSSRQLVGSADGARFVPVTASRPRRSASSMNQDFNANRGAVDRVRESVNHRGPGLSMGPPPLPAPRHSGTTIGGQSVPTQNFDYRYPSTWSAASPPHANVRPPSASNKDRVGTQAPPPLNRSASAPQLRPCQFNAAIAQGVQRGRGPSVPRAEGWTRDDEWLSHVFGPPATVDQLRKSNTLPVDPNLPVPAAPSLAREGNQAKLSFPLPGGQVTRMSVPLNSTAGPQAGSPAEQSHAVSVQASDAAPLASASATSVASHSGSGQARTAHQELPISQNLSGADRSSTEHEGMPPLSTTHNGARSAHRTPSDELNGFRTRLEAFSTSLALNLPPPPPPFHTVAPQASKVIPEPDADFRRSSSVQPPQAQSGTNTRSVDATASGSPSGSASAPASGKDE